MKTLYELCKPRASIFDEMKREDTLDLDNLRDGSINAKEFFKETYVTDGMNQLFDAAFRRFEGTGQTGLIRLTQAMGGGKTHNMVALGLLAKNPGMRKTILGDRFETLKEEVKVVTFTGRESDAKYGIWGEIAAQLGKSDQFKDYYTPLSAPGQSAWINLLKGQPLLIMMDELPPYLDYAKTIASGDGTLANITGNALANLFNAVGKRELANVCVVVSDLKATYESGSKLLEKSFKDLDNEINRSAIDIEPVRASSDDLYLILKKRLFETLPNESEVKEVAVAYKETVNKVRQMGATNYSAETTYAGIVDSYPFHPSIKDLFARFKENNGFQQTRGFIRLSRLMVRELYDGKEPVANSKYLINAYDYDLNQGDMASMIRGIKPKLTNAVSHDIASEGKAVAEELAKEFRTKDAEDLCKLILMSSLGDVTGTLLGLSESELAGIMAAPDKDMIEVKKLLEVFRSKAWYLYSDKDGRQYFKDVKNINAELNSIIDTFTVENAKQEVKKILEGKFTPKIKDCYQNVLVFPAIDEITLSADKITLVLFEPNLHGGGLHKDLATFYETTALKNRAMFLTGQRNTMDGLLTAAKEHKAITTIINRLKNEEKVAETDTQYIQALEIQTRIGLNVQSAAKETFVTLYYPTKNGLQSHEIEMNFNYSNFNAEEQIRTLLADTVMKFDKNTDSDDFRKKIEARIFTAPQMAWKDVLQRAAENTAWQWHHPNALAEAKDKYVSIGLWQEVGGLIDKNPPLPSTEVFVKEIFRDDSTGEVTLKLTAKNGDKVFYEIEQEATPASSEVVKLEEFKTKELRIHFLCVDSAGKHDTGKCAVWTNTVGVKYKFYDKDGQKYCQLLADNDKVEIRYTTDGSNPKADGAKYIEEFTINEDSRILQAIAVNERLGIYGELLNVNIASAAKEKENIEIKKDKQLVLAKKIDNYNSAETYKALESYEKHNATLKSASVNIQQKGGGSNWLELSFEGKEVSGDPRKINEVIDQIKQKLMHDVDTDVTLNVKKIDFKTGQDFEDWVAERQEEIKDYSGKISQ